jgi:predicted phage-related endonuclease
VKEAFVRESLDSTKLKKEMPELFEKYKKQTKVKPSLLIKIGEEE